jgi:hypothetical protein
MGFFLRATLREFSLPRNRCYAEVGRTTSCSDISYLAAFPGELAKVAVTNVDTAGREVLLSGQEGICVQWR